MWSTAWVLVPLPVLLAAVVPRNESCQVGDDVDCPGSPHYQRCQGNECCASQGGMGSFACPSAAPGWQGCDRPKRYDCVQGGTPEGLLPEAVPYFPHFDTSPDYLGIAARAKGVSGHAGNLSDNYYLVLGDWGGCGFGCCCEMQQEVADKMAQFVRQRKQERPHSTLLFVLALGDNFYWSGATAAHFNQTWLDVYAPELLEVPWFAVMGNHDYGNDDPTSGCPSVQPRFVCEHANQDTPACGGPRPYSTQPQGYNSNQLNANKGGVGDEARENFHMPDYTYYYSIPELRFELLAMDWNWLAAFPGHLGGNGIESGSGASKLREHCGSADRLGAEMKGIQEASMELLFQRSASAEQDNVAIISHYPDGFQGGANLRKMFLDGVPQDREEALTVFNFFGHTHIQECQGYDEQGRCVDFLSGGGGGCCSHESVPAGFSVVSFSDMDSSQYIECFLGEKCSLNAYKKEL